ncbi:aminopeptidase B-like isoform X2 [Ptychodera flava]|uniref:aminopeptidase B-like isoform X2 n=1 Tax=Ptychodera flava TaxID=63121 RepID=UPI00396A399C
MAGPSKRLKRDPEMSLHSERVLDVATASNYKQFTVLHFHLDLDVRFESRSILSTNSLDVEILEPCDHLILDVHESLTIDKITKKPSGESLKFEVKDFTEYGKALHISLKCREGEKFQLEIKYTASDRGPGVCWLKPVQTAGRQLPYLFTQGWPTGNRSIFPCVDTPAVKSTYSATVKVPDGFTAVMSANEWEKGEQSNVFKFNMTVPIPAYLVAMAVGDLVSAEIGPRSRVWTEPSKLEAAKAEFEGVVEEFICTGEKLFGPYVWGRYDLLVMPPSFPFGGMENPCLTFVTPCVVVGDKSLTDVVMHEIAHSWFGNLVTNATWSDFWLNEGFTMYAQRRICTEVEAFGEAYTCLEAATGQALLREQMDNSGEDHPLNRLRVVIEPGVDPDDTYNETPYEKGYCFCCFLQSQIGSYEKFDEFLKAYVERYKFKSIVAEDLFDFFFEYFPDFKDKKDELNFEGWLHNAGWPSYVPDLSAGDSLTKPAEKLAAVWAGEDVEDSQNVSKDISNWKTYQVLHFLDKLLEKSELPMEDLSSFYPDISHSKNAEIQLRWSKITLKNDHQPDFPQVKEFLESQGKQKYTVPVYQCMQKGSPAAQKLANEVFAATRDQLHVNVENRVAKILGL